MKKMLIPLLSVCFLLSNCGNKDDMTEAEIMELPEVEKSYARPAFSGPIELEKAIKAINAYRKKRAVLRQAFNEKEFGVAHDPAELTKYMQGIFQTFVTTHTEAEKAGYKWQVGFGYGIARIENKRRLNLYIFPVLVKTGKTSNKPEITDYFKLRKDNNKDTAFYLPDITPNTQNPRRVDDPSFVFDEGALWP